uniref:Uncharacterized protein n=1 Tax=Oryzias sinensis TaxID=183150 RepID=A0A8C7WYG6_9TELE
MSELRLYCDLLVQQVQTIQSQNNTGDEATPTSEASLLSATCTTFIQTLEECMSLANQSLMPDLRPAEKVTLSSINSRGVTINLLIDGSICSICIPRIEPDQPV